MYQFAVSPQSTVRSTPVIAEASSEARNAHARDLFRLHEAPHRDPVEAVDEVIHHLRRHRRLGHLGVREAGNTQFTRMRDARAPSPWSYSTRGDRPWTRCSSRTARPPDASIEAMWMMEPPPVETCSLATANAGTRRVRAQHAIPARDLDLEKRTSSATPRCSRARRSRPQRAIAAETVSRTCPGSATSAGWAARAPVGRDLSTAFSRARACGRRAGPRRPRRRTARDGQCPGRRL